MAGLHFADQHNMVAYLVKTEEKDGPKFHEIVDFLNHSYIRYALTISPTLYPSQIKQFWKTSSVITLDDKDNEDIPISAISATVDGQTIYVTEKSLRRHLQLDDSNITLDMANT